ncbi:MAG: DNA polymerase III subunit epsilon [Rhodospirillaceae bacterium]|nr:DNA polymerase III subunit epsilon [Rhodospirillaceae bacterium]|tara:strand:+ start:2939 stop:3613 length:675 start_codon:yes stop_codon:yes gene_type:complete
MYLREVILDTETTGLDPKTGHRIIEIGALELINHLPTGRRYQTYVNPERDVDGAAFEVHGLSSEFLKEFPVFADIVPEFLDFLAADVLIIHNAPFDIGFINMELSRLKLPTVPMERVVDTLQLARQKYPGAQASLNALCRRFDIDNSHRNLHGALVDVDLLAGVYLELIGGRQPGFTLENVKLEKTGPSHPKGNRSKRRFAPTDIEKRQHLRLIGQLTNPLWKK